MEGGEPLLLFGVWEVDGHVSTRRDDVELGVKDINTMHDTVEARHCECHVRLILTYSVLAKKEYRTILFDQLITFANDHSGVSVRKRILLSGNLLEGTGDDEVSMIHCNQVSCELAGEVVVILKFLPVKVRVGVLGFLKCMGNGTLCIRQ